MFKRIQKQIAETIPQERVQQRTVEHIVRVPVPTVQEQRFVPVKPGAQVTERIQEHIAKTIDQEEIDQLRKDLLMETLSVSPRGRKSESNENENILISSDVPLVAAPRLLHSRIRCREVDLIFTKVSCFARGVLVIFSPWSQDFGRQLIGAGWLVVWCSCVKVSTPAPNLPSLSNTGGAWHNAKKQQLRRSSLRSSARVWVSHCCVSNPEGGPF